MAKTLDYQITLYPAHRDGAFAYALNPGFENNEGGYGELSWSLEADKIDVSHSNRYIETNTTEHEGL